MKLSIVIVNYNVKHFLEQALRSVLVSIKNIDAEIWVVDNNSVDQSNQMVKELFPQVKLIENKINTGFSKANNQAIVESKGEYVLLLNPDTVLQSDTLEKCITYMDANQNVGGLGVRMIDGKGKFLPESKRGLPTPSVAFYKMIGLSKIFGNSKRFGKYHLKYLDEFENHEVDVLSGAYMMLRKKVLDEVGLLDESFFMYGEDIDLSYRITQAGYKNVYFSDTTIIHYKGESTKKKSLNYVKIFYNAMVLFAEKHYSKKTAGLFSFFINTAIYLKAGASILWRGLERIAFPAMDFAILYLGFYGITRYWEQYNKFVRDFYPNTYFGLHLPAYILIILFVVFLSGGYDKPQSIKRVFRGVLVGALLLFAAYAFLPKSLQFSRAILMLGCLWSLVAPILFRLIWNVIKYGNLNLTENSKNRILLVAEDLESNRIKDLLSQSMVPVEFLGLVGPTHTLDKNYLGSLEQLEEITEIFNINTIIFSAQDVNSNSIMQSMNKLNNEDISFKIVPPNSMFIIGSNSRNSQGELFGIDISFKISETQNRRKKRIFDLLLVFASLLFFPIFIFFKNSGTFYNNLIQVFLGFKTWFGYSDVTLPTIKKSVFSLAEVHHSQLSEEKINLGYARDYSVYKDIELFFKLIKRKIVKSKEIR